MISSVCMAMGCWKRRAESVVSDHVWSGMDLCVHFQEDACA